jgi:hypothetical protein
VSKPAVPPLLPDRYVPWPAPDRALLGRGGASEVWRAQDRELGVLVALKVLRAEGARLAGRLEREAMLAASVVHPNVIALHDMGRTPEALPYSPSPWPATAACWTTPASRCPGPS